MEQLRSIKQTDQVLSEQKSFLLLKHSTRCPVSAAAYQQVTRYITEANALPVYLVLVIENRDVSDHLAQLTGVRHESPQIFVFKDGEQVWNASHQDITLEAIHEHL